MSNETPVGIKNRDFQMASAILTVSPNAIIQPTKSQIDVALDTCDTWERGGLFTLEMRATLASWG